MAHWLLNYYQENLPENSSISSVYPTLGMQIQIIPKFILATQINNPIPINNKSSKKIPSLYKFGGTFEIYAQLCITTELQLASNQKTDLRVGIEYLPNPQFVFRTGFIGNGTISFGIAFKLKNKVYLETGYELHPVLNSSIGLGFGYKFNNVKS